MLLLKESDTPKSLGEKVSEFFARPPQPILRFYGDFSKKIDNGKKLLLFSIRNGIPFPLLYGVYVETDAEYIEKTDHIGPWSVDNWALVIENPETSQVSIRVGIVPFEILTDRVSVTV